MDDHFNISIPIGDASSRRFSIVYSFHKPNRVNNLWLFTGYFIISAVLLGLPFANHHFFALSWFAFALYPGLADRLSYTQFFMGCLFSAVIAYGFASYWAINFFILQGISYTAAIAVYCFFLICVAIGFAVWMSIYKAIASRAESPTTKLVSFVAAICAHFLMTPTPFPITPAITQGSWQSAIYLAVFGGETGLMLIMVINSAVIGLFAFRLRVLAYYFSLLLCLFFVAHILVHSQRHTERTITFGWVQPNAPPGIQPWAAKFSTANPIELQFSRIIADRADIIVWPESGRKEFIGNECFIANIQSISQKRNVSFVIQDIATSANISRNSLLHIQPNTEPQQYFKQKLIPFGEYQPLSKLITGVLPLPKRRELHAGSLDTDFHNTKFSWRSRICYEVLFSGIFKESSKNIDFITLSSNQSWFASSAQTQLIKAETQLRAVESQRTILHVNNAGPSWVINARGEVIAQSPANTQGAFLFTTEI